MKNITYIHFKTKYMKRTYNITHTYTTFEMLEPKCSKYEVMVRMKP
jgi:hypothetical protein